MESGDSRSVFIGLRGRASDAVETSPCDGLGGGGGNPGQCTFEREELYLLGLSVLTNSTRHTLYSCFSVAFIETQLVDLQGSSTCICGVPRRLGSWDVRCDQ